MVFFFSSRRRHTRLQGDWSSDVCSSDLETCASCHGHLKSLATLQAVAPPDLFVSDLETVELDLAAWERGFRRPARPGFLVAGGLVSGGPGTDPRSSRVLDHARRGAAPVWG